MHWGRNTGSEWASRIFVDSWIVECYEWFDIMADSSSIATHAVIKACNRHQTDMMHRLVPYYLHMLSFDLYYWKSVLKKKIQPEQPEKIEKKT